jgi:hypothetical protein
MTIAAMVGIGLLFFATIVGGVVAVVGRRKKQ